MSDPEENKAAEVAEASSSSFWARHWIFENIVALILALFVVLALKSSVIEPFKIPSGSMIPTLLIGDHILVNKFAYGLTLPFSEWFAKRPIYIHASDPPKRGDIIVFKYPKDEEYYFIKRVIGVPGDVIEIRNKVLLINKNTVVRDPFAAPEAEAIFTSLDDPKYSRNSLELFKEHLDTASYPILLDKNNFLGETSGPITVPPGELFVMGDNRDFSNDSRFWGFVPFDRVKGKAFVIWLSLWFSFNESQVVFRPSRVGTMLR